MVKLNQNFLSSREYGYYFLLHASAYPPLSHLVKDHGQPDGDGETGVVLGHIVPSRGHVWLHRVEAAGRVGYRLQQSRESGARRRRHGVRCE